MHELSIALSIAEIAADEARKHQVRLVKAVHIRLGALSGVEKTALESAYELARAEFDELAESALKIEDVHIIAFCPNCRKSTSVASIQLLCCTVCNGPVGEILHGKELEMKAIEASE